MKHGIFSGGRKNKTGGFNLPFFFYSDFNSLIKATENATTVTIPTAVLTKRAVSPSTVAQVFL